MPLLVLVGQLQTRFLGAVIFVFYFFREKNPAWWQHGESEIGVISVQPLFCAISTSVRMIRRS